MKNIFMSAVGTTLICLSLVACSSKVMNGMVSNKVYEPAYSYVTMQCSYMNEQGICMSNVPITHNVPDKWIVEITGDNSKGEQSQSSYRIDETTYSQIELGDHMVFNKDGDIVQIN